MPDDNTTLRPRDRGLPPTTRQLATLIIVPVATLQLLAIAAMLVDHYGLVFADDALIARQIGRVAMPFFAIAAGLGAVRTRSPQRYMAQLLALGLVSQVPYAAAFHTTTDLNIGFTLLSGVGVSAVIHGRAGWLALVPVVLFPWFDYGLAGVLLVVSASFANRRPWGSFVCCMAAGLILNAPIFAVATVSAIAVVWPGLALSSSGPRSAFSKFALYAIYPSHLALFALLSPSGI